MAENKSRIRNDFEKKIAGLQHSANATNVGKKHYFGTVGFQRRL